MVTARSFLPRGGRTGAPAVLRRGVLVAAFVLAALVPSMTDDQYVLDILVRSALFLLLACGLNLVVAHAGLLDLGYIAFFAIGAYVTALMASPFFGLHQPLWATTVASVVVSAAAALILGYPTLRLRGDYLAIVTLGFGEIVRIALVNMKSVTGGASGLLAVDPPRVGGYEFGFELRDYYYLTLSAVAAVLAVSALLRSGRSGMTWASLRDDELAARSCGINPLRSYLAVFAVGAAFAGLAGSIHARVQTAVSPESFTVDQSFLVLTIVVLAGVTTRPWPLVLASALMILVPELLRFASEYRLVIFGPLLVLAVIYRENRDRLTRGRPRRPTRHLATTDDGAPAPLTGTSAS